MNPSEAFDKLWNSLVDVEDYLRVGIPQQLQTAVSFAGDDMQPVHEAFGVFRRVDPYITPGVRETVTSAFDQLQTGLNEFLDVLRVGVAIPESDHNKRASARKHASETLNRVLTQHQRAMRAVADSHNANLVSPTPRNPDTYDAFISHASEDKDSLVKPLAESLIRAGYRIWYDEFVLTVGDSIRRSIDKGRAGSRFGIVILSPAFLDKNWTQYELDGLVAREMEGSKVILPIWHNITKDQIMKYSPSLADKYALSSWRDSIDSLASQLSAVLKDA